MPLCLGGVILIGGQSGNTILDTLYELKGFSSNWKKMPVHLETPRRFHIAFTVSSDVISECSAGILLLLSS
jgi:hypothetical protein